MLGLWLSSEEYGLELTVRENNGENMALFCLNEDLDLTIDIPKELHELNKRTHNTDPIETVVVACDVFVEDGGFGYSAVPFDPTDWGCRHVYVFSEANLPVKSRGYAAGHGELGGYNLMFNFGMLDQSSSFETLESAYLHNGTITQNLLDRLASAPNLSKLEIIHRNVNMAETLRVPAPANKDNMEVWGFDFLDTPGRHIAETWEGANLQQLGYTNFDFQNTDLPDSLSNGRLTAVVLDNCNIDTAMSTKIASALQDSDTLEMLVLSHNTNITELPFLGSSACYHVPSTVFGSKCKCYSLANAAGFGYFSSPSAVALKYGHPLYNHTWLDHKHAKHTVPCVVECGGLSLSVSSYPTLQGQPSEHSYPNAKRKLGFRKPEIAGART